MRSQCVKWSDPRQPSCRSYHSAARAAGLNRPVNQLKLRRGLDLKWLSEPHFRNLSYLIAKMTMISEWESLNA
ncbi:hypothetical protein MESS2_1220031 [Mesorhizobium metallidurans STM 2683]|uniref:Transposase n=1 Tax=Mesorhizobium metallidurans STM 2683 TaxID=1297569 RepID=M5EHU6_9HYPH|nr:hypothetical protein MESS2_1220031 [Mesorhizobium metallidurans STM 2683]